MGGTPTTDIGPGLGAFVAFFALALLLWLLMRNMNGRMRRMAYLERERVARMEAKAAESSASDGTASPAVSRRDSDPTTTGGATPPGDDPAAGPAGRSDDEHTGHRER